QYKYITIPAGLHSVKLTRDGYQDATTNAQVDVDKTTYYNPVLEAATGQVYVTGEHLTGAEIYVDDVATGVLIPGTVTVSVGRHNIVAKKEV
ncbi:PEGA domain-containing protein, partial [candidate division WOR-3 bacterium]|nr:PEGA domain-containing protein [candidate division WOR-3 bacterium]